ncbi:MAG: transglycosylase SLT domain-containing protein [Proteobacteria bacterium]|nr:transglycosylase SLT domain-containing protein [Pseudomonadota bacterium]
MAPISSAPSSPSSTGGVAEESSTVSYGALNAEMVRSYFVSGIAKEAAHLYRLDQFAAARLAFRRARLETDEAEQIRRIDLMIAATSALVEDWPAAIAGFEAALEHFPLLADWLHHKLARAYHASGNYSNALGHARRVDRDAVQGDSATMIAGDVLRYRESPRAMVEYYRRYLKRGKIRRLEARFRLGSALERLGELASAAQEVRRITVYAPLSPWAKTAQKWLDKRLRRLPWRVRKKLRRLTAKERIARAMVFYKAHRNRLAEAEFAAALKTRGINDQERCTALYHRANSWWKLRRRSKAMPLFERAIRACNRTDLKDLQVKAAFQAGRSFDKLDREKKSINRLALIEKHHPDHSYADDARLLQAESYQELGDIDRMKALLSSLPELYPDGDMKAEALWRLAWSEYGSGNYQRAIHWLKKQIEIEPVAEHWERRGQAQYWIARCHGHLGDPAQAIRYYRETIRLYPLSYYSLLALNRLREEAKDVFAEVEKELHAPPRNPAQEAGDRSEYNTDSFRRAIELLRLGLMQSAVAELARLGFETPAGKNQLTDPAAIDKTWMYAFLNHHAGRHAQSHWVTRWHVLDYRRHWPQGVWRDRWRIAYPRAWWPLLDKYAAKRGYATELLIAFVREESGFDPLRESWANAIGLTQMIVPTAEFYAEGTGIEINRETLLDPETNVIIGSKFLQALHQRWNGHIALIVPSYNTGASRVARWLKEAPDATLDEFAENIYYDEPRSYNKRVTESFFAYSYLNDRSIPLMPNHRNKPN